MKKFLFAVLTLLIVVFTAQAQSAVERAAGQLATLTNRINGLDQRVAALEQPHVDSSKRTYAEAYRLALESGKPLVVWNGAAICSACVHDTADEFVSFVGTVEGCPADAITVAVPEGGELVGIGIVNQWVTGDAVRGHVPSIRGVLSRWRNNRQRTFAQPTSMYQTTTMMVGGCASCGTSGGRGLFGRR